MPTKKRKLTAQQRLFVAEYCKDLNASAAARRAGYSEASAGMLGYQLLQNPLIADAIAKKAKEHLERADITVQDILRLLHTEATRTGEGSSHSARVQALTQLGRYHQMFVDRIDHTVTHKFSDLSDEELQQWVNRIAAGEDVPEFLQ